MSARSTARAHWRPSRIAQTTRLCPRRMSPQENTFASLVRNHSESAETLPRGRDRPPRSSRPRRWDRWAHREQDEVGLERNSLPAISCMRPSFHSARTHQARDIAVFLDHALGQHRPVGAFLVARGGAQLERPIGPVSALSLLGRLGQISSWVTLAAPCGAGADAFSRYRRRRSR